MTYEFHPEAEQEFLEAAVYYERNVTGLGQCFGNEIHHAREGLVEYPELGSPIDSELRRIVLPRFPHFLIYCFSSDLLRVIAGAHARRLPGYWQARVNH